MNSAFMQRIQKLLLAIIVIATGLFFLAQEIEPKTDGLWFHFIGIRSFEPERAEAVISSLAVSGTTKRWRSPAAK